MAFLTRLFDLNSLCGWTRSWHLVLLALGSLPVLIYHAHSLVTDYWIPVCLEQPDFFEDFDYFYWFGERVLRDPRALYDSPDHVGTLILSTGERIFHPYVPIAGLFFAPLVALPMPAAYLLHGAGLLAACLAFTALWLRLWREQGLEMAPLAAAVSLLYAVSMAPFFLDISMGNVNAAMLGICILFVYLLQRDRPVPAGIVLAAGFWFKLFPVLLMALVVQRRDRWIVAASFCLFLLSSFLLSLLFIPFELYQQYYFHILPEFGKQTMLHMFNQSLPAMLTRLELGPDSYTSWDYAFVPGWARLVTYALAALIGLFSVVLLWLHRSAAGELYGAALIMGLIPLITPVGWGYTFVMILPMLVLVLQTSARSGHPAQWLVVALGFTFLVPSYFDAGLTAMPAFCRIIFFNRYVLATLALMAWVMGLWIRDSFCTREGGGWESA